MHPWLAECEARGIKLGLDRMRAALAAIGHPQRRQPVLLVGGTNGKGSTVAFAEALLRRAGHRVGATISPHLVELRERFRLQGASVDEATLDRALGALEPALRGRRGFEDLTFFELGILAAAWIWADAAVDVAVAEVGMGGELDATVCLEPLVLALTSVDLDHQAFLGPDLASIAGTKARAAPPGGIVVSAESRPDRVEPIEAACAAVGATLWLRDRDWSVRWRDGALSYEGPGGPLDDVPLGLQGAHQAGNAGCAVAAVAALGARSGLATPDVWQAGDALQQTRFPGRLERLRIPGAPAVLLDGAHNPAGAEALAAELARRRRPPRRVWLYAALGDKERGGMLAALLPHVDAVVCTRGDSTDRYVDPALLAEEVRARGAAATVVAPVGDALRGLLRGGGRDEILVAGSLYLVGDALRALRVRG